MPHVVVEGPYAVGGFHARFLPEERRADGWIIKFDEGML